MFILEDCVAYIASDAMKKITFVFNELLKKEGSTRVQWIALYYISGNEGINQSDLAKKMNLQTPTVARLIDRLEREKYVERYCSSEDRRILKLRCTEKGLELQKKMLPVGEFFSEQITDKLSVEEINTFLRVLTKLVDNSEKIDCN